jgi:hypothetical protein
VRRLRGRERVPQLFVFAREPLSPAQRVDRPVFRGRHEPRARLARDARRRPLLERGDEGILGKLLSQIDIADEPSKAADEPRRFDAPHGVDRALQGGGRHAVAFSVSLRRTPAESRA